MANKSLFQSLAGALLPPANAINNAGGPAQYAAARCLNGRFYADVDRAAVG